ncbi:tetratricopeptide repeat protein, partial [Lyngbya sp. CCY1209]|uniref:tetratricopeptide repeat protein n=1 Tax=Lyngbya sp. CCY1209 TaxID=2886103 RepID=UPI002D214C1C
MWTKSGWSIWVAIAGFYAPAGWVQLPALAEPTLIAQQSDSGAADASLQRGMELLREGTAESLRAAIPYFEEAARLYEQTGDRANQAFAQLALGRVYSDLGEKQQALEYYEQALPLFQAVGDRSREATTLNNIGRVYSALGEKQTALEYYEQALPLRREVGDRSGEATTLNSIGGVYSALGEKQTALEYYERALPLRREVGDRSGEATTLYNIAFLQRSQGSLTEALANMEQAIGLIEELRSLAPSGELRQTFFSTVQDRYQFYIELLMQLHQQNPQKGYDAIAFHASERSRARTLLELLREANADIRQGVDPELVAEERRLQQKLDAAETRRLEIFGDDNSTRTQKENIQAELTELLKQYEEIRARIRAASPRYAALTQPQPLTLVDVQQQVVDEETVLLQYSLGEESSYLWVVTPTEMTVHELPGREEIEAKADDFLYAITSVTRRDNPRWVNAAARELSEMILQPAADHLQKKRLLISADG